MERESRPNVSRQNIQPDFQHIKDSPAWYVSDIDIMNQRFDLRHMDEAGYRSSLFLDRRIQSLSKNCYRYKLDKLLTSFPVQQGEQNTMAFIFHIGHCGSTLLSRSMDHSNSVLSLREPVPFKVLAKSLREINQPFSWCTNTTYNILESVVINAMSRTFSEYQFPMIKTSSMCNNLIENIISVSVNRKAVLLFIELESYMATMLKAKGVSPDLLSLARLRIQDWVNITGTSDFKLCDLSLGELTAMSWMTNMYWLLAANKQYSEQTLLLDFECLLRQPNESLEDVSTLFSLQNDISAIQTQYRDNSSKYSKSPNDSYSSSDREIQMNMARETHRDEIAAGLGWAQDRIAKHPEFSICQPYIGSS